MSSPFNIYHLLLAHFLQKEHFLPREENQFPRAAGLLTTSRSQTSRSWCVVSSSLSPTPLTSGPTDSLASDSAIVLKVLLLQWFQISRWRWANSDLAISSPFSISTACYVVGRQPYLEMLLLFKVVSAHGSFMMWLEANFIFAMEVRQRETAGSGMQSPILIQIAFLPQIEHGLLESTASLSCVTTLKENGWYLQHFILFNYDRKIPDKLPVDAHSSYLYCTTVSANFPSPGT